MRVLQLRIEKRNINQLVKDIKSLRTYLSTNSNCSSSQAALILSESELHKKKQLMQKAIKLINQTLFAEEVPSNVIHVDFKSKKTA